MVKLFVRNKKLIIIISIFLSLLAIAIVWYFWPKTTQAPAGQPATSANANQATPTKEQQPQFNAAKLQQVLDDWASTHAGMYSVVIKDTDGKTLAKTNAHTSYFTASIYKLYVAYIGYQRIDDGTYSPSETYLNGWTRQKCLYEMIHQSHSPCAEKMWVELGKQNLTNELEKYGLKDTSMVGLTTSAADAAIILSRLQKGQDLSQASREAFLKSMKTQIYRDALPTGFTTAVVYDKVGFNGKIEYHDVAIVKFDDGRELIVSVLTKNAGSGNIAGLARAIQASVL